jgi:hypothetical protein
MSVREIMARIERERVECMDFRGFQAKDPTKEALAAYAREIAARRGSAPMPEGGLFDDCARRQQELF